MANKLAQAFQDHLCLICGKYFKRRLTLKRHVDLRVKTGRFARPLQCRVLGCGTLLKGEAYYKNHCATVHHVVHLNRATLCPHASKTSKYSRCQSSVSRGFGFQCFSSKLGVWLHSHSHLRMIHAVFGKLPMFTLKFVHFLRGNPRCCPDEDMRLDCECLLASRTPYLSPPKHCCGGFVHVKPLTGALRKTNN